jgi:hypothetical protein
MLLRNKCGHNSFRYRWQCGPRRRSAATRSQGSRVQIPLTAWKFSSCVLRVVQEAVSATSCSTLSSYSIIGQHYIISDQCQTNKYMYFFTVLPAFWKYIFFYSSNWCKLNCSKNVKIYITIYMRGAPYMFRFFTTIIMELLCVLC